MQHLDDLLDNKLYQYETTSAEFDQVKIQMEQTQEKLNKLQERYQVLYQRIAELELELDIEF